MRNEKGFTLIELLAVIVILAILMTVSIPAVSRYLDSSRRDTYIIDISQAVNTIRTKALQEGISNEKTYTLTDINTLLDKKLVKSPYGKNYDDTSYIKVVIENNKPKYKVCIVDNEGNGLYNSYNIEKSLFVTGNPNDDYCHAEDDITAPECIFQDPSPSLIYNGSTSTILLNCTDDSNRFTDSTIEASDIEIIANGSGTAVINSIEKSPITNGYEYAIIVQGNNTENGNISLRLNESSISDDAGNSNLQVSSPTISVENYYILYDSANSTNYKQLWNGGHSDAGNTYGYAEYANNNMRLRGTCNTGGASAWFVTKNLHNIKHYTKININVAAVNYPDGQNIDYRKVVLINSSNSETSLGTIGSSTGTKTFNISSYANNSYYIKLPTWINGNQNSASTSIEYSKVWLSR